MSSAILWLLISRDFLPLPCSLHVCTWTPSSGVVSQLLGASASAAPPCVALPGTCSPSSVIPEHLCFPLCSNLHSRPFKSIPQMVFSPFVLSTASSKKSPFLQMNSALRPLAACPLVHGLSLFVGLFFLGGSSHFAAVAYPKPSFALQVSGEGAAGAGSLPD